MLPPPSLQFSMWAEYNWMNLLWLIFILILKLWVDCFIQTSERTLDAPDLVDDYYLNLLDWGSGNVLAIALGNTVYLWDASDGSTTELVTLDDENGPVTSVKWAPDGRHIAVGLNNSAVQLWDSAANRMVCSFTFLSFVHSDPFHYFILWKYNPGRKQPLNLYISAMNHEKCKLTVNIFSLHMKLLHLANGFLVEHILTAAKNVERWPRISSWFVGLEQSHPDHRRNGRSDHQQRC